MCALNCGNDSLKARQKEERLHCFLIGNRVVVDSALVAQVCVLGTNTRVVQSARDGIYGKGLAVFILEKVAVKAVESALRSKLHGCGVIAHLAATSERLNTVDLNGVCQEGREHTERVGAASNACANGIGHDTRHFEELISCFIADDRLEVSYHLGEGVGAKGGTDAVDGIVVLLEVCLKRCVNRFLEGLETCGYGNDVCAEHLHTNNVGMLLCNVDLTHVDIAFQAEVSRRGCKRNAMLTCARFGNELLLAHVLCKQALAHAVVELVRTGVVEVLTLEVDLAVAKQCGKALAMEYGRGSALELLADAAKLVDELCRVADRLVGIVRLLKRGDQLGGNVCAAVFAKVTLFVGKFL